MTKRILINIQNQQLTLLDEHEQPLQSYPVSTATNGIGQYKDSYQTPLGLHEIVEKIGQGAPHNTCFLARQPTGEIYTPEMGAQYPNRDWIVTRILRLRGLEAGFNQGTDAKGRCCDSWARYIYIHGTPDTTDMSVPGSKGCIRLFNEDMCMLFDQVHIGMHVCIEASMSSTE